MIRDIGQSRVLFLDSGPLVRLLQMHPDFYPAVSGILDMAYEKNVQVLVSSVTLFEISSRAFENGEGVSRTNHKITEAESLRLATAFVNGADCILTECANFRSLSDALVVTLDEV